ncbi:MAG: ATP-binding protein [Betaproteobacteria bacterium]|nr:ATP-binding protein [Betaproteobacteria bacterium]
MVPRTALATLLRLARGFPIVALTGPRQSGKTTLARAAFPGKPYVSLENADHLAYAATDTRRFLADYPAGAVIDEVQRCPELFAYLQGWVDERRRMGDFVLTGSQQFGLMSKITQSLAGRVGLVHLLPFSQSELAGVGKAPASVDSALWQGAYPALYDRNVSPADWFPNYAATYVERDVRQLLAVRQLGLFQRFLKMCAARSGQLLNLSSLAADCGISHVTAREWLTVLEASYIVRLLPPYHRNFGKRLVKTPKLYFLDVGLAAWLLGIRQPRAIATHAMRGALFETFVVGEFIKQRHNAGQPAELYFWRDNVGHEIDLLFETGDRLQPVEIKSGMTFSHDWLDAAKRWKAFAGDAALDPWIIHGGDRSFECDGGRVFSWRALLENPAPG